MTKKILFYIGLVLFCLVSILTILISQKKHQQISSKAFENDDSTNQPSELNISQFTVTPDNFLQVINDIKNPDLDRIELIFSPGEYKFTGTDRVDIPATQRGGIIVRSNKTVNYILQNKKYISFKPLSKDNQVIIYTSGDVGIYFQNCEEVNLDGIKITGNLSGSNPLQKSEDALSDPLRSLILIEDSKTVKVQNSVFEGQKLPDGNTPDGIASLRGFTVIDHKDRGNVLINLSKFINNPWDAILTLGEIDTEVANSIIQRDAKPYAKNQDGNNILFSNLYGSAVVTLNGSALNIHDSTIRGFTKAIGVAHTENSIIRNINIEQPVDWNSNNPFTAYWIIEVFYTPLLQNITDSDRYGTLTVNNLTSIPIGEIDNRKKAPAIPRYISWIINAKFLRKLEISNLSVGFHIFEDPSSQNNIEQTIQNVINAKLPLLPNTKIINSYAVVVYHQKTNWYQEALKDIEWVKSKYNIPFDMNEYFNWIEMDEKSITRTNQIPIEKTDLIENPLPASAILSETPTPR